MGHRDRRTPRVAAPPLPAAGGAGRGAGPRVREGRGSAGQRAGRRRRRLCVQGLAHGQGLLRVRPSRRLSPAPVPSPCPAAAAMEVSHSLKERTIAENSLVILLQGLRGRVTTVELRDESAAAGRVTSVDAFMNVRLAQVTFTDRRGAVSQLDELFVTGRNIRYVHIPDEVDIRAAIEEQLQAIHRVRYFGGRDKGRSEFPHAKHK
ncbi:U7 snRNA-associated Sm-like protein LSm10 isoform X10 [Passer domesticus]|uniref:U7 snRNA-associated Sm-like protein LSm10 isoform X10 n=1 Tax=Passer domesticus TaxID=48849 RepID=UPI0030FE2433